MTSEQRAAAEPVAHTSRVDVCQALLDLYDEPRYLEVGVCQGHTFVPMRAAAKVAVDPNFVFDFRAAEAADATSTYHQVTSDAYFREIARIGETFDVIYLDGLHTFEQTLRDLNNALLHLREGGAVVVDDVMPTSYVAALPELAEVYQVRELGGPTPDGMSWMGDVYRLVFYVEQFMPGLSFACTGQNHGQLVLWRAPRAIGPERTVEWVSRRDFKDCILSREVFRFQPLEQIVGQVAAARRRSAVLAEG